MSVSKKKEGAARHGARPGDGYSSFAGITGGHRCLGGAPGRQAAALDSYSADDRTGARRRASAAQAELQHERKSRVSGEPETGDFSAELHRQFRLGGSSEWDVDSISHPAVGEGTRARA